MHTYYEKQYHIVISKNKRTTQDGKYLVLKIKIIVTRSWKTGQNCIKLHVYTCSDDLGVAMSDKIKAEIFCTLMPNTTISCSQD